MKVRRLVTVFGGLALAAIVTSQAWAGGSLTAAAILGASISGLAAGAIFAVAAGGLVVTYVTSGVFNFAQGAIGMLLAFVYWELRESRHLPTPLCLVLVLGVAAPVLGAACEFVIMRRVRSAPLVHQIMVSVALMLALMGIAGAVWPSTTVSRSLSPFFGNEGFRLGPIVVTWHRTIAICVAALVAISLRLLLFRTRLGVAMRACVDDRDLAALHGARPNLASMSAWSLGSIMAALAGILLAPEIPFSVAPLTLLIIDAFAAAIMGRLSSLLLTFVGALLLGLLNSYAVIFLDLEGRWSSAPAAIPMVFLFFVLLSLPQGRIAPVWRPAVPPSPRAPSRVEGVVGAVALVGVTVVLATVLPLDQINRLTLAVSMALIMLSLVPLTGWAGEVSLAPMTLAGIGAITAVKVSDGSTTPLGLLLAAAVAVLAGLAMAAPAVRLRGLYMALASLAFARMVELLVFPQPEVFGVSSAGTVSVAPLTVGSWHLTSPRALLAATVVTFAVASLVLLALRAGAYGRRMIALRDSPAACATLGVNVFRTKLSVYALSSAIAGLGGVMFALHRGQVGTSDFTMLAGLPVVLLVVVGGITTISGALFGGLAFTSLLVAQSAWQLSAVQTLTLLGPGLAAIAIGHSSNGAAPAIGAALEPLRPSWLGGSRRMPPDDSGELGLTRPFTVKAMSVVEDELRLPQEYRHGPSGR
ncbi:ABC transporter permease subunit [Streptomyces sp. NBC_01092]|uniref:branched-chain amino acid ABC transporter permease n=1 Tax=Streptomyces sp. NBC_01092 TaxID=2903748 RepID=UPI003870408E|nr:ABC transporter permease [Streptomyces sp. NBC_01092]